MMKAQKKLDIDDIEKEEFELKPYMENLKYNDAILRFRLRAKVCNSIKTHMKSDPKFTEQLWSCGECSLLETSFHLKNQCVLFEETRKNLDFNKEEDIIFFFRQVIEKREKEEEEKVATND